MLLRAKSFAYAEEGVSRQAEQNLSFASTNSRKPQQRLAILRLLGLILTLAGWHSAVHRRERLPRPALPPHELMPVLNQTTEQVRAAGRLALDFAQHGAKAWKKGDASFVTEADVAVDSFLKQRLPGFLDGSGWLSEESVDNPDRLNRNAVWVVDPIDGTRSFMEGVPVWVISVALVVDGAPVLAVIHNPSHDEMFTSLQGQGAFLNGSSLRAMDKNTLEGASVCGPSAMTSYLKTHGAQPAGYIQALAYRLSGVAAGRFHAALSRGNAKDWDIAAADLILRESGAVLTGFDGRQPLYNQPVPMHPPLVASSLPLLPSLRGALADIPYPLTQKR
jgi:myo-inositol-1(or 4)-monophosphatase